MMEKVICQWREGKYVNKVEKVRKSIRWRRLVSQYGGEGK